MKYCVISKNGEFTAIKVVKSNVNKLIKSGYVAVSLHDSKENANGMIMGLRAHSVVEKYAGHLPKDIKVAFKSEIANIAADMYNQIIK